MKGFSALAGLLALTAAISLNATENDSCTKEQKDCDSCKSKSSVCHQVMMYIPNRVIDLSDIVNVKLGAGSESSIEAGITNYAKWGASYGEAYYLTKDTERQYGGAKEEGFSLQDARVVKEKLVITDTFGTVKPFFLEDESFHASSYKSEIYEKGIRDFWEISVKGGVLANAKVAISPVQLADAVCGFFLIDFKEDDL